VASIASDRTANYDTNIQTHLMLSPMENDMAKEGDFLEIHTFLENENLCSNNQVPS
jgi:hypothetical protein